MLMPTENQLLYSLL